MPMNCIHRYDPRGRSEQPTERSTAAYAQSAIQRMREQCR